MWSSIMNYVIMKFVIAVSSHYLCMWSSMIRGGSGNDQSFDQKSMLCFKLDCGCWRSERGCFQRLRAFNDWKKFELSFPMMDVKTGEKKLNPPYCFYGKTNVDAPFCLGFCVIFLIGLRAHLCQGSSLGLEPILLYCLFFSSLWVISY